MYQAMIENHFAYMGLGETIRALLSMMALCTVRLYAAFMVLPATGQQTIQGTMRNGMCLLLGFFVAWGQPAREFEGMVPALLVGLLLKEALLGVLLSFAFSSVFWIAESAGALVDNVAGFNNVQQTNPLTGQQSTPISNLMLQLLMAGFYMLGGMLVCIGILFESFGWWPVASLAPPLGEGLERFVSAQVHGYYAAAVKLAAPVMLVIVLIDLAFGLLSKTADKLEPQNLSQPVKSAVATMMLALLVAVFFDQARPAIGLRDVERQLVEWAAAMQPPKSAPKLAPK
jgi:type III secretion protein T